MDAEQKEWLTGPEAAELLGVSVTTLYKLIHRGQIKPHRPTGTRLSRFSRRKLMAMMERSEKPRPAPRPKKKPAGKG